MLHNKLEDISCDGAKSAYVWNRKYESLPSKSEEGVKQNEVRISELEGLKVIAEDKTLKEAKEAFLKAREEEIKMEAENLFNGMKTEWEKNVKPKEVTRVKRRHSFQAPILLYPHQRFPDMPKVCDGLFFVDEVNFEGIDHITSVLD